jgi:tetratricopeptide (TPR) repeat protein
MTTDKAQKRLENLQRLIKRLEQGEHIQNRTIKTHLTEEQYNNMLKAWEEQQSIRKDLKEKPEAIKNYENLLRKAQFVHNKAESKRFKGKGLHYEAEAKYERALEHIQEQIGLDPELLIWLDRNPFDDVSLDPIGIPRVITSKSLDRVRVENITKMSKAEVKIKALQQAIVDLESTKSCDEDSVRIKAKLKGLLDKMRDE